MSQARPLTILCITSYEKGQEFLRACKDQGCRVLLLTVEKFRDGDWPRESIDEMFYMPPDLPTWAIINTVSYMARWQPIDRIVALDEFDMENAAALREHLRIPGMGLTTVRHFRDKLAMRGRAKEDGINVPEFVHVLNHARLQEFMSRVNPPWLLKPRSQASGIGMKKIHAAADLWPCSINWATNNRITCSSSLYPATSSTWIASFPKAKSFSPRPTPTARRRSILLTREACSLRARFCAPPLK